MNRICIVKATGKLIEFQSGGGLLGTLTQNAIKTGYNVNAVEEKHTELTLKGVLVEHETPEDEARRLKKAAADQAKKEALALNVQGLGLEQRIERIETLLGA